MMFDWLNETEKATRLEAAIAPVIADGKVRTYGMGGEASTLDVVKAVADCAGNQKGSPRNTRIEAKFFNLFWSAAVLLFA
jgi:hypothetical protein